MMPFLKCGPDLVALVGALAWHAVASAGVLSPEVTKAERPVTSLSVEELRNATYVGLDHLGPVKLADGRWTGAPPAVGAASGPIVELADGLHIVGDLNADGVDEAVVVLVYTPGGTANFSYLAVVTRTEGIVRNIATLALGDRVQIRSVRIESGRLLASAVQAGAGDAACCPGDVVNWQWTLGEGRLNPHGAPTRERLSLEMLAGTVWVLRAWDISEAAGLEPEVTLAYGANRLEGSSGCNRYSAAVVSGTAPGDVKVGPLAGTRMACPDPQSSVEARFLEQLGRARTVGFRVGRLAITYTTGTGATGVMLFDARTRQLATADLTTSRVVTQSRAIELRRPVQRRDGLIVSTGR